MALPIEQEEYYGALIARMSGRQRAHTHTSACTHDTSEPCKEAVPAPSVRVVTIAGKGKGLVAGRDFKEGDVLFMEEPLASIQNLSNRTRVRVCDHCHTHIGTLQDQVNAAITVRLPWLLADSMTPETAAEVQKDYDEALPPLPPEFQIPQMDANEAVVTPVHACLAGCGAEYCSERCRNRAFGQYHWLTCVTLGGHAAHGTRPTGGPSSAAAAASAPAAGAEEDINAAELLLRQATVTHEVLLLAARAIGRVLEMWWRTPKHDAATAMRPFAVMHHAPWWTLEMLREEGADRKAAALGWKAEDDDSGAAASKSAGVAAAPAKPDEEWVSVLKQDLSEWIRDSLTILRTLVKQRLPIYAKWSAEQRVAAQEAALAAAVKDGKTDATVPAPTTLPPVVEPVLEEWVMDALFNPELMETIITASELNSIEMKIDSPLHDYFRALHELEEKAAQSGKSRRKKGNSAAVETLKKTMAMWEPILEQAEAARSARRAMRRRIREQLEAEAEAHSCDDEECGHAHAGHTHEHEHGEDCKHDHHGHAHGGDGDQDGSEEGDDDHEEEEDEDDSSSEEYSGSEDEDDSAFAERRIRSLFPLSKGTALFAIISTMNHSCVPNVQVAYLNGNHVGAVLAKRDIAAGEELCINYVGLKQPLEARRGDLQHYGFVCECPKCIEEAAGAAAPATTKRAV